MNSTQPSTDLNQITGQDSPEQDTQVMFESLLNLLTKEQDLYDRLCRILEQKQQAIVDGNVDFLKQYTVEESALASKIGNRVEQRSELVHRIADHYHLEVDEPRLSVIRALAPSDIAAQLQVITEKLEAVLRFMTHINQQNDYLLRASLDYTRGMIDLLYDYRKSDDKVYDPRGAADHHTADARLLDYTI